MATAKQNDEFAKLVQPQYLLDEAIDFIQKNLNPEDVFPRAELVLWAKENDYVEAP